METGANLMKKIHKRDRKELSRFP